MPASLFARLLLLTVTKVIYSSLKTDDNALTCSLIGSAVSHPSLRSLSPTQQTGTNWQVEEKNLLGSSSFSLFIIFTSLNERIGSLDALEKPRKQERKKEREASWSDFFKFTLL